MRVIYKYPILHNGTTIRAPFIEPLDIQYQDGVPTLWAIVDTEREADVEVWVCILPTGLPFYENPGTYFKTLQDDAGYVWHFFIEARAIETMPSEVSAACH